MLALVLGDPSDEYRLVELAERTGIPYASVHREVDRGVSAGLLLSRLVGRTRLIRADPTSPYFEGLADILVKAFGAPWVIGQAFAGVGNIESAYIYGSWAAHFSGMGGERPVEDIDLLILGTPARNEAYAAASVAERRLGRVVQVTIRSAGWLDAGEGAFHATVTSRPMVPVQLAATET